VSIGNEHFDTLLRAARGNSDTKVDWNGVSDAMRSGGIAPGQVLAVSWCDSNDRPPPMWTGKAGLGIFHARGALVTTGKRKMLGGGIKGLEIDFSTCRRFGPIEDADDRGYGKYCIEFAGPGDVLLGILEWPWSGTRLRDPRNEMMAAAAERDRILDIVSGLIQ
jgi:hypothetical protein